MVKEVEFQELKDDVKYIRAALTGNGKPGLIDRVRTLEIWKWTVTGALIIIGLMISYGILRIERLVG